ncbi:MAG: protein kinase, partial [Gemmataceae bacterium]
MMSSRDEWRRRLRANLEESWKRGNPVAAEKVVAGAQPFPVTADDLLDLLLCEAKLCRDAGQFPDLQEFIQRAPQLAAAWHARLRDDPEALKVFGDLHATSAHIDQLISTNFDASTGFDTPRSQPADNFASLDAGRDASRLHAFADPGAPAVDPHETRAWGGDVHDPEATRAPDTKSPAGQASDVQPRRVDTDPHATAGDVNELAPTLDLEPGWAMVPGYEILGELGRGGMGVVYKASQAKLRRIVALKMILAGSRADQIELTRFQREAEAVARLQHPNIVQIYEVGEHEGKPFFSLEFVDGGSLAHQLKENLQTPRKTAETMLQLAEAMHVAHERGIVHRDLKPANILVTRDGVPKITDFGLAKNLEEDFGETRSGQVMGTPSYMSPEQASGQIDRIGPATDVYALGAILYEMLSGRPPFKGTTLLDLLSQVRNEEPIAPRRVQPKVPYDLETICLRCLQKEPGKRYASAQALAADLRRYLNGEPIEARRTPLWERTIKYVRRSPWVAGFWGLVALGLIAGSFWGVGSVYQRIHQSNLYVEALNQLLELQNEISKQKDKGWQDANWQQAAALMSGVQGMIRTEPALSSLQATANQLQEELTREQAAKKSHEEGSKAARDTYQGFRAELNKAMINQLQNVGLRQQANLEAVRQAAPAALARYDVTLDSKGQPRTDNPYLTESERASILPGCYELLLAWAHATAHPLRDKGEDDFVQARKALAILARARSLGLDTRAYHMRRGTYLLILGDKKEAQQELEQARNMEPRTATDNYLVGAELFDTLPALQEPARTQAYRQAIQYLQRAVELRPEHYWANFSLGRIYLQSARPDAAVARLTACIQQQPEFLWAYPLRAHAHGMLKEYDAAEADYALAEKLPDDEVRYSVFVNRGLMYFNQGQDLRIRHAKQAQDHFARAIGQYHQAIALQPNQYQAHVNLAQLYQTQGRLGDALENL